MYLEKIKVEKDDTILVHFDKDNCDANRVAQYLHSLGELYPNNPIIPIYEIKKFETRPNSIGNSYIIESSSEC